MLFPLSKHFICGVQFLKFLVRLGQWSIQTEDLPIFKRILYHYTKGLDSFKGLWMNRTTLLLTVLFVALQDTVGQTKYWWTKKTSNIVVSILDFPLSLPLFLSLLFCLLHFLLFNFSVYKVISSNYCDSYSCCSFSPLKAIEKSKESPTTVAIAMYEKLTIC